MDSRTDAEKDDDKMYVRGFSPKMSPHRHWVDDDLMPLLTLAERSVVNLIIRQTFGFLKSSDHISIDQFRFGIKRPDGTFRSGTGLGRNKVRECLAALERAGAIICTRTPYGTGKNTTSKYEMQIIDSHVDYEWLRERHEAKKKTRPETRSTS